MSFFYWFAASLAFFISIKFLIAEFRQMESLIGFGRQKKHLLQVTHLLRELEETLMAGLLPPQDKWKMLQSLQAPWGELAYQSLSELRSSGSAVLPTLKRLRALAEDQISALSDAQSRSSQAFAQAFVCSALIPLLGLGLYYLMPGIEFHLRSWLLACISALGLSGLSALWLLSLAESARWGGLGSRNRPWILGSLCAGERFLAKVRTGTPPDLAWTQTTSHLTAITPELALAWGHSVWESPRSHSYQGIQLAIVNAGDSIKKAVQLSLMEGKPSSERVESALLALKKDIASHIDRELTLLATRALKPLFLCVAPAIFALLIYGMWLTAEHSLGGTPFGL